MSVDQQPGAPRSATRIDARTPGFAEGATLSPQATPLALVGSKVALGPVGPGDAAHLFRWVNDATTARQDLAYRPVDWITFGAWLHAFGGDASRVLFTIRRMPTAELIGYTSLASIDCTHRSAALSIRIGDERHRGQGYGVDALRLLTEYAWHGLNLHRVSLTVLKENSRAIRCYRAAGFDEEGTHRDAAFINGRWQDVVAMAAIAPACGVERRHPAS